jgi:hypothetical protein
MKLFSNQLANVLRNKQDIVSFRATIVNNLITRTSQVTGVSKYQTSSLYSDIVIIYKNMRTKTCFLNVTNSPLRTIIFPKVTVNDKIVSYTNQIYLNLKHQCPATATTTTTAAEYCYCISICYPHFEAT